ncbi:MAG TPA: TAT-variant-translocated molybdopterin oxidoreductase [Terriglobales bacterium]|nr:TAT-variant-translocated molybdopterin oxidoreductase [Terriglobales bacterium]
MSATTKDASPKIWTTMEELNGSAEVERLRHEEFHSKPAEYFEAQAKGGLKFGRRDFLKWSTGALALAATACERKPIERIIPYAQQPPEIIPGVANYYASTCTECAAGCGILLKTHEGRPTKVEGNPLHPINRGSLCARGQASLFNLYDPDRLRTPVRLQRVASLQGLVGNAAQPNYNLNIPTNVWNTGETLRSDLHPIKRALPPISWADADKQIAGLLNRAGNRAVLLTGTIHGPARTALLADFLTAYPARHVVYDAINPDAALGAQTAAYGGNALPRYFFDRAEMVVTFGADPIGADVASQGNSVGFGRQRKLRANNQMSRVVVFEPAMSLIGMSADSRYLVPPSQLLPVALGLAHQIVAGGKAAKFSSDPGVTRALASFTPDAVEKSAGLRNGALAALAAELASQPGKSIVCGGGVAVPAGDAAMLETVVAFINAALGNEGATIDATSSPSLQAQGSERAMLALVDDMKAGKVDTLVVYGTNPAYTVAASAGFIAALAQVPNVVVIADRMNETAQLANYVLPSLHGAESWGDAEPQVGLYSLVQPTIEPLFNGRSFEDSLLNLAYLSPTGARFRAPIPAPAPVPPPAPTVVCGPNTPAGTAGCAAPAAPAAPAAKPGAPAAKAPAAAGATAAAATAAAPPPAAAPVAPNAPISFHDYLVNHWREQIYAKNNLAGSFDDFWTGALQAGVFDPNPKRLSPGAARTFKGAALAAPNAPATAVGATDIELSLAVNPILGDGTWANNALLQEIPNPVWKSCWDNYFVIAPSTAKRLGLEMDDDGRYAVADVSVNGQTLRAPIYVQVGVHPSVASIAVGYGRQSAGEIGTDIGVNAFLLGAASGAKVSFTRVAGGYLIASPQENNYMDFGANQVTGETGRGENIIHQTTLVQLQANPRAGNPEAEPQTSLWDNGGPTEHPFATYRWGMTIDMNACIGCNACVAACYAENNVPVVGKDQVWRGREMAWLRIDRYFSGEESNPDVTLQPMLCQQCSNAGCESVCPVIATITDSEGINVQVYNRCVGTRFCSNNCIYKVRRFNFYNYSTVRASPLELALNPSVTVRSRGVMEKCNFCTQRIHDGHYRAKERGLPVRDGDIVTACMQTCPTQAIVFGNTLDPESAMMRARSERGYKVLDAMNFQPSITYLTKVRNRGGEEGA